MPVGTHTGKKTTTPSRAAMLFACWGEPQTPIKRTMLVRLRVLRTLIFPKTYRKALSLFACFSAYPIKRSTFPFAVRIALIS